MKGGQYLPPKVLGWGLEFHEDFLEDHTYPTEKMWKDRPKNRMGTHFDWPPEE